MAYGPFSCHNGMFYNFINGSKIFAAKIHRSHFNALSQNFSFFLIGKLGIARFQDHLSIAVFLGVGLLHLDEVAVGLAHRTIS